MTILLRNQPEGKTTTTGMLTWILEQNGLKPARWYCSISKIFS